jgi:2-polyprenyl-3-methyl-5-hydroxy-6-metoxy-1,4-benzoquinol methylase
LSDQYFKYDVRKYFEQYTTFEQYSVLDFGCNHGNFVRYKSHHDYTGVDINKAVIEQNKEHYRGCSWIHYDGYNKMYNPGGTEELVLNRDYDKALLFSVITHMTKDEAVETIRKLKERCETLYVTFFSHSNQQALNNICRYRKLTMPDWSNVANSSVFYFEPDEYIWSFYDDAYAEKTFGGKVYDTEFNPRSLLGMQKCLVI